MAMQQKGSRRMVVDGQTYRWRIRRSASSSQLSYGTALIIAVEHADGGAVLVVACDGARHGNWIELPGTTVTPSRVAALIRRALAAGWTPTEPGPAFFLAERESAPAAAD
jgi:hypothetical protein